MQKLALECWPTVQEALVSFLRTVYTSNASTHTHRRRHTQRYTQIDKYIHSDTFTYTKGGR